MVILKLSKVNWGWRTSREVWGGLGDKKCPWGSLVLMGSADQGDCWGLGWFGGIGEGHCGSAIGEAS